MITYLCEVRLLRRCAFRGVLHRALEPVLYKVHHCAVGVANRRLARSGWVRESCAADSLAKHIR